MSIKMRHGLTLVEAIVSIGIIAVVLGVMLTAYLAHGTLFRKTQAAADLQDQMNLTLRTLGGLADVADGIVASRAIGGKTYVSSATTTVLEIPSVNAQGRTVAGSHDYAAFYIDPLKPGRLVMSLDAATSTARVSIVKQLSDAVQTCYFRYDDAEIYKSKTLSLSLSLRKAVRNEYTTLRYDQTYALGNVAR